MAVINLKAEQDEIKAMLGKMGVNDADYYLILDKLRTNEEAHLRYLKNARKGKKD